VTAKTKTHIDPITYIEKDMVRVEGGKSILKDLEFNFEPFFASNTL